MREILPVPPYKELIHTLRDLVVGIGIFEIVNKEIVE